MQFELGERSQSFPQVGEIWTGTKGRFIEKCFSWNEQDQAQLESTVPARLWSNWHAGLGWEDDGGFEC